MSTIGTLLGSPPINDQHQDGDQVGQAGQLEKNTPAPLRPLLVQRRKGDFLQQLPFPRWFVIGGTQDVCSLGMK